MLAWIAANPLALCGAGATVGGAAYYFSGNRYYGDAAIGALEGCEAGLNVVEIGDLFRGPALRPTANLPDVPEQEVGLSTRRSLSDLEADGALTFLGRNSDGTPAYGADGAIDGTQVTEVVQELLDDGQTVLVLTGTHGSRDGTLTPERQFTAQDLESFREVGNGRVEVVDVFDAGARCRRSLNFPSLAHWFSSPWVGGFDGSWFLALCCLRR